MDTVRTNTGYVFIIAIDVVGIRVKPRLQRHRLRLSHVKSKSVRVSCPQFHLLSLKARSMPGNQTAIIFVGDFKQS